MQCIYLDDLVVRIENIAIYLSRKSYPVTTKAGSRLDPVAGFLH
jgi:hypothetical protein